jgi:hypothetical protein
MRTLRFVCVLLLLSGGAGGGGFAENAPGAGFEEYAPEKVLGFARSLIAKREFYRAYMEIQRLDACHPGFISPEKSHITSLYLMHRGANLDGVLSRSYAGEDIPTRCADRLFKSDVYLSRFEFAGAAGILSPEFCEGSGNLRTMRLKRLFLASTMASPGEVPDWNSLDLSGIDTSAWGELARYAQRTKEKEKDPRVSLALGLVPGLGYAHAGNGATGIMAGVVISVLAGLSYLAFKTENQPLGILFGIGATVFYGGSIIGGYREAARNNAALRGQTLERLSEDLQLDKDRETLFSGYGIGHGKN